MKRLLLATPVTRVAGGAPTVVRHTRHVLHLRPGREIAHSRPVTNGMNACTMNHVRWFSKVKSVFVCSDCGGEHLKWQGQCSHCGAWNTLKSFTPHPSSGASNGLRSKAASSTTSRLAWNVTAGDGPRTLMPLEDVAESTAQRIPIPMQELARVLGGGVMPGSVTLLGGAPGIGKSTILLQLAAMLCEQGRKTGTASSVAYVSGEESAQQLKVRATRLGLPLGGLLVLNESNMSVVMEQLGQGNVVPTLAGIIVDSIQSMRLEDVDSYAGGVSQVRECTMHLVQFAKHHNIPVFVIGHITKGGEIAGPQVLAHLVDTVLFMEGEDSYSHRLLRTVKNRFGSTSEVGVFDMGEKGLFESVDPASVFLSQSTEDTEPPMVGSAVAATMEGTRPLCVEIQALCDKALAEFPRHRATGIALDRVHMLLAALHAHAKVKARQQDVFVKVAAGIKLSDPAADLALAMAITSSIQDVAVPRDMAFIGEVGLGGQICPVTNMEHRIGTAAQLGFRTILAPVDSRHPDRKPALRVGKTQVIPVRTLRDAVVHAGLKSNNSH